jgi:hypothetical protein
MATDDDARQEKSANKSSLGTKVRPSAPLFFMLLHMWRKFRRLQGLCHRLSRLFFGPGRPRQALRSSGRKVTGPAGAQAVRRLDRAETDAI